MLSDIVIVSALRSPIGKFGGQFKHISAAELATQVSTAVIERSGINPQHIDHVIFGNVLQAGSGQNIARQIALNTTLPLTTPAMTINEVCGSGLKSIILGIQALRLKDCQVALVGGTESMSNAPYYLTNARWGARYGNQTMQDSILIDGLTDAFSGEHMGITAENVAKAHNISRKEQDHFAYDSHQKAAKSAAIFEKEIVPICVKNGKNMCMVSTDENIREDISIEKLSQLKPAFQSNGTVTAGNASSLNDGAAAILLTTRDYATQHHLPILASIVGYAEVGNDPNHMGFAPVHAVQALCEKTGLSVEQFDCIESNEAFAAQSLAVANALQFDITRVNQHGGAIALGHPIGASGARIVVSLINALKHQQGTYGLATLCVGGGIGLALALKNEH